MRDYQNAHLGCNRQIIWDTIFAQGVGMDKEKVKAVLDWHVPANLK